eukprot:4682741-Prymnesium_polylepis.1
MASASCDALLEAQRHAEAVKCFAGLPARSPADHFHSAAASRALNDFGSAVESYGRALRVAPTMAESYLNLGWVLSELDRAAEATSAYTHGLRLGRWPPQTAAISHNNLGVLLRKAGRGAEANAHFEAALAAVPDFAPALENARGGDPVAFAELINSANELLMRDAVAEAEQLYRRALPLRDPRSDGAAYVGLGAALHGSRRLDEARHVLAAGARINPAAPSMLRNLATVRTDLEDWKGAAATWRRALVLDPSSAESYRVAAGVLQKAGRPAEAITWLQT